MQCVLNNVCSVYCTHDRRKNLLLNFGKKCLNLPQTKELFPLNTKEHTMDTRYSEKYTVQKAHTSRLMNSTVPTIQRILNEQEQENNIQ